MTVFESVDRLVVVCGGMKLIYDNLNGLSNGSNGWEEVAGNWFSRDSNRSVAAVVGVVVGIIDGGSDTLLPALSSK